MRWLASRLSRVRWMAVPIAAYLAITLALPLANGAALHGSFWRHAGWVIAGCVAMVGAVVIGGLAGALVGGTARRLYRYARERSSRSKPRSGMSGPRCSQLSAR